jgi:hypothetical protein
MSAADQTVGKHQSGVACPKPRHRLGGRNIVASKNYLDGDQVLALALALAAWLVVVSVFGWIDWELP